MSRLQAGAVPSLQVAPDVLTSSELTFPCAEAEAEYQKWLNDMEKKFEVERLASEFAFSSLQNDDENVIAELDKVCYGTPLSLTETAFLVDALRISAVLPADGVSARVLLMETLLREVNEADLRNTFKWNAVLFLRKVGGLSEERCAELLERIVVFWQVMPYADPIAEVEF